MADGKTAASWGEGEKNWKNSPWVRLWMGPNWVGPWALVDFVGLWGTISSPRELMQIHGLCKFFLCSFRPQLQKMNNSEYFESCKCMTHHTHTCSNKKTNPRKRKCNCIKTTPKTELATAYLLQLAVSNFGGMVVGILGHNFDLRKSSASYAHRLATVQLRCDQQLPLATKLLPINSNRAQFCTVIVNYHCILNYYPINSKAILWGNF